MKKVILIVSVLSLVLIGYILAHLVSIKTDIDTHNFVSLLIDFILMLATIAAVVVALWKESILSKLNHPRLVLKLQEGGFIENIDSEQENPQADDYLCLLEIENEGNIIASNCDVHICEFKHSKKSKESLKVKHNLNGNKTLFWEAKRVDIPVNTKKDIWLFRIKSPNGYGTPTSASTISSMPVIEFNGIKPDYKYLKSGYWEVSYYINCQNGETKKFTIEIKWDGVWKTRKTEMVDALKVTMK